MPSQRFSECSRRITELRSRLLPRKFDPTGLYSDRAYERTRAFRLLVHAEFESYIEDRVLEVSQKRFAEWDAHRSVSRYLVGLLAYHDRPPNSDPTPPPTTISTPPTRGRPSPELAERVKKARNALEHHIRKQNNGVKEENLLRMLMWIGVESAELDTTWLASMTSFGEGRGEYAHSSGRKIKAPPDPARELRTVRNLLDGFKQVDSLLDRV